MQIKLLNGDCLELMKDIPDKSIDCIICDLPYGTTACAWDIVIPFDKLWEQYNRIIKETGTIILFGSQPFTTQLIVSNLADFRYELIWCKNNCSNFQLANKQPLKYHENICVFYKDIIQTCFSDIMKENMARLGLSQKDLTNLCLSKNGNKTGWVHNKLKGTQIPTREQWQKLCELFGIANEYDYLLTQVKVHTYNTQTDKINKVCSNKGKKGSLGHLGSKSETYIQEQSNYPHSILRFNRETEVLHPTQKPIDLLEWLVTTYSNKNDIVLDNTMGSGTTGVACKHLGRNFIGIEKDKTYFTIAKERIDKA